MHSLTLQRRVAIQLLSFIAFPLIDMGVKKIFNVGNQSDQNSHMRNAINDALFDAYAF
jgi:hypothetical protein